jgi:hypothetical protein
MLVGIMKKADHHEAAFCVVDEQLGSFGTFASLQNKKLDFKDMIVYSRAYTQ